MFESNGLSLTDHIPSIYIFFFNPKKWKAILKLRPFQNRLWGKYGPWAGDIVWDPSPILLIVSSPVNQLSS